MAEKAFNGKILNIDLSQGVARAEALPEQLYRDYLGGYGLGVRLLFDRIPVGADPLGPDNVLGLFPGLLTGTLFFGSRWQAVTKSPKNNGWGDANGGGDFGAAVKRAGWDGILFYGRSDKPVYLLIEDDKVEVLDAAELWGMLAIDVEQKLKEMHGQKASVACIGPAGETCSLMAGICNDRGRLAARSAVGAVMGSKKVKAVVVKASRAMIGDDPERREAFHSALAEFKSNDSNPMVGFFRPYGTVGNLEPGILHGDSPVKNWGGVGQADFGDPSVLSGDNFNARMKKLYGCWRCPLVCGSESLESEDPAYPYPKGTHRPEFETAASFGTMTLNNNIDSIIYLNHLCNQYGFDTISAGATVAFAIECYENGLITNEDTDGLELRWGATEAIVAILQKMGRREGFGDVLADGVKRAAERLGPAVEKFAMHIGGEELPMHDPKYNPGFHTAYRLDPTPARHMQHPLPVRPEWGLPDMVGDRTIATGRGLFQKGGAEIVHIVNAAGLCAFTVLVGPNHRIPEWINVMTGWDMTREELLRVGERIANLRMAFSFREGDIVTRRHVPGRSFGSPPQGEGPHAGFTLDVETLEREFLEACDWDIETGRPSRAKLISLGLEDVARQIGA